MGGGDGVSDHSEGAGDDSEGYPGAPRVEAWGSGEVLRTPGWKRGAVTKAPRVRAARDTEEPAQEAGHDCRDERSRDAAVNDRTRHQYPGAIPDARRSGPVGEGHGNPGK